MRKERKKLCYQFFFTLVQQIFWRKSSYCHKYQRDMCRFYVTHMSFSFIKIFIWVLNTNVALFRFWNKIYIFLPYSSCEFPKNWKILVNHNVYIYRFVPIIFIFVSTGKLESYSHDYWIVEILFGKINSFVTSNCLFVCFFLWVLTQYKHRIAFVYDVLNLKVLIRMQYFKFMLPYVNVYVSNRCGTMMIYNFCSFNYLYLGTSTEFYFSNGI